MPLLSSINLSSTTSLASISSSMAHSPPNCSKQKLWSYPGLLPLLQLSILPHPLSNRLSHLSFLLMSHNHHRHPSHLTSWISAEVSLPLCLLTCLSSRLHITDKMAFLKCKYDHSICCPQNVDSNKPGLLTVCFEIWLLLSLIVSFYIQIRIFFLYLLIGKVGDPLIF